MCCLAQVLDFIITIFFLIWGFSDPCSYGVCQPQMPMPVICFNFFSVSDKLYNVGNLNYFYIPEKMYFSPSMNVVACKTDGLSMSQYFFFNCIMSENGYI